MKKFYVSLLALLVIFALSQNAQAQKIGPKIGYNLSTISLSGDNLVIDGNTVPAAALGTASNLTYGLFIKSSLVPMLLDLQLEVNYDPRGTKFSMEFTDVPELSGDITLAYNYLTIPALLKLKLLVFYVEAGPYASFLLSAKSKFTSDYLGELEDADVDIKDETKSTDFGLMGGLGIQLPLGPVYLMGGARYTMGMTDIMKENETGVTWKHSVWTFYAGLAFGL